MPASPANFTAAETEDRRGDYDQRDAGFEPRTSPH
jgi:hypothetical protein